MRISAQSALGRTALLLMAGFTLASCNALSRLVDVGAEPTLTKIQNPVTSANYRPVSMPMPAPITVARSPNSLWRPGRACLFQGSARERGRRHRPSRYRYRRQGGDRQRNRAITQQQRRRTDPLRSLASNRALIRSSPRPSIRPTCWS